MSKLFKQFHNMEEYEKSKISFTKDNSSYVYGTDFSKVYTSGDDKSDIVSYNTICFIDESKEIFRNCANYSGLGKYAYTPTGTYLEVGTDSYIHGGISITNAKSVTTGSTNVTYIGGKQINLSGLISGQAYSGMTIVNNNGFSVNSVVNLTNSDSSYYGYIHTISTSTGGRCDFANYGEYGDVKTSPKTSMSVGFRSSSNYGFAVSSYDSSYVVGTQYNFYQVGDSAYQYNKIAPLDSNGQVPTYCLDTFKSTINYFPYDYKSNDGVWYNLNNKVLTMSNGSDATTNFQFGFYNEPYLVFHSHDVQTVKITPDGCWIYYEGTTYKMNFAKMIELGILEA